MDGSQVEIKTVVSPAAESTAVRRALVDRAETVVRRAQAGHPRAVQQLAELVRDLARAVAER